MWSRLQLFFGIQAATFSVGLTSSQSKACLALASGFLLGGYVFLLFVDDDRYRRAARVGMEQAGCHAEFLVPIVGEGKVYESPTRATWVLVVILALDVVLYVLRAMMKAAPLAE